MISINKVYKTVLSLSNTDIRGNINPSEIRLFINQAVQEIYEEYFLEINRSIHRENRGFISGGLNNVSSKIQERIQYFLEESDDIDVADEKVTLPTDLRYLDSTYLNGKSVNQLKNRKEFEIVRRHCSELFPIGYRANNVMFVAPVNNFDIVQFSYLRNPKTANWTYNLIGGAEVFNPSHPDFQDIDLHPSEEHRVVLKTLNLCGVNLKEQDLQAFTTRKENTDFNEEITN